MIDNKKNLIRYFLDRNLSGVKEVLKNYPEHYPIPLLVKDLRDALGASLEIDHNVVDWIIEHVNINLSPIIKEYYVSLISKHLLCLGVNPNVKVENFPSFIYSHYVLLRDTLPADIFCHIFADVAFKTTYKEENENFFYELVHSELEINFFPLLCNNIKLRLVTLDQTVYQNYLEHIINGVTLRTNVNVLKLLTESLGERFISDIYSNPKYSMRETDVWQVDLLASAGRSIECYWEGDTETIKLTQEGQRVLNSIYTPFWKGTLDLPIGLDYLFLPFNNQNVNR